MFSTPKLKTCLCLILLVAFTASMAMAGSPEWAWDQGSYEQDGTVTMDGEDYSINPTGHQSLTGKSVRQPPTVIVQSTASGGGGVLLAGSRTGNLGGDTSYCESQFGSGYVVANIGEVMSLLGVYIAGALSIWAGYKGYNCQNWTNDYASGAVLTSSGTSWVFDTKPCSQSHIVPCIKRQ